MRFLKVSIEIHPLFYLFMILSVMTGYMKDFFFIMLLILIHECGHLGMALFYHWNVECVKLLPLGGLTIFKEDINRPLKEELMIVLAGPSIQILFYLLVCNIISDPVFGHYHTLTLLFNLLPIVPLDGSKIINILMNYRYPFLKSYRLMLWLSIIMMLLLVVLLWYFPFNMMFILIIVFLGIEVIRSFKKQYYIFNRFLLERYQKRYFFHKRRVVRNGFEREMKRDYYHIFYQKQNCYSERQILAKRFDFTRKI